MLHGNTPWTANTEYELINTIQSKPLVISPHLSTDTKDLLTQMLQINEKDRIDWDTLLKHTIFKERFKSYLIKENELENKLKYLMS